jgi:hypothetical protein
VAERSYKIAQVSRCPSRGSNWEPPEYKSEMLENLVGRGNFRNIGEDGSNERTID